MSRVTGRHTRPKKLNPKQNVQIFREEHVELFDYDAARAFIETGVEKSEESVSPNQSQRRICLVSRIFLAPGSKQPLEATLH